MSRLSSWLVSYWLFFMLLSGFQTVGSKSRGDGGDFGGRTQRKSERAGVSYPDYDVVKKLHTEMDTNHDGDLEEEDTKEFIEKTLHQGVLGRTKGARFHFNDAHISVEDLLDTWHNSEVYHWTCDDVVKWLTDSVGLPRYEERFRDLGYNGTILPWLATNDKNVLDKLGITSQSDRKKLQLKAIDVVLFGAPKYYYRNILLDVILIGFATCCAIGLFWTWKTKREAERELDIVISHMKAAEEELKMLQNKLTEKNLMVPRLDSLRPDHHNIENMQHELGDGVPHSPSIEAVTSEMEALILRKHLLEQEVDSLQNMSDQFYFLLQLTYKKEKAHWEDMKKAAEKELHAARRECEKLRKKKMSIFSTLKMTNSSTLHDTDVKIHHAIITLKEVTEGLEELSDRWKNIEHLCNVSLGDSDPLDQPMPFNPATPTPPVKKKVLRQVNSDASSRSQSSNGRTSTQSSIELTHNQQEPTTWSVGADLLRSDSEQESVISEISRGSSMGSSIPQRSLSNVVPSSYATAPIPRAGTEVNLKEINGKDQEGLLLRRKSILASELDRKSTYLSRINRMESDSMPSISERPPGIQKKLERQEEAKFKSLQSSV